MKTTTTNSSSSKNRKTSAVFQKLAGCCSHRTVAFAETGYRDMRVFDFLLTRLKVLGA
jgi:hypothetical protein